MGLFGKKPHVAAAARPAKPPKPGKQPKPGKPPKPPKAAKQPKPGKQPKIPKPPKMGKPPKPTKPPKPSKGTVNPADFIALRFEMIDLRARLEASEQSKAIVETRLAALDAGNEMARRPHEGGEVRHRIDDVEAQLRAVAAAAAAASAAAESASAKATAAAAAAAVPGPEPVPVSVPVVDETLSARVDELTSRIEAAPDANRLAELEARIDAAAKASRLSEIEVLIEDLAAKIAAPPPSPESLPAREATVAADLATTARLDQISARVDTFDALTSQLAQLNARVTAQAEFGAQLSSLRDRIAELSNGSNNSASRLPVIGDDDLRDNVQALTYRVEVLAERVETGEVRARQTVEQLSNIEHRMSAVSTELTNQVSELGRDIDGFGGFGNSNGEGEGHTGKGNGHVSAELLTELQSAQIKLAEEQARYEIAFRQDLATLAEHVRRAKGG